MTVEEESCALICYY